MRLTRQRALGVLAVALVGAVVAALLFGRTKPGPQRPQPAASGAPVDQALTRLGEGPLGGVPVLLARWRYREQAGVSGERLRTGDFAGREVTVPFSPNARTVSGPGAQQGYEGTVGWFARTIDVPEAGRYALSFASAHHAATVYLDGRPVRRHVGAYEPFSTADELRKGRHTVSVRVDWRGPQQQAQVGYARGWFNFGGLNGRVTLARVGESELGALTLRTQLERGGLARVTISARVRNRGAARNVRPQGTLVRTGQRIPLPFRPVSLATNSSGTVTATVLVPGAARWSPGHPDRYALTVGVPGESVLRRKVGLRELQWDHGRLWLNGRPLELRGAGLPADAKGHGDALTPLDEERNVAELQAAGANATRSQLPLSDTMLDRLDAAGILVWQEIGPWEPAGAFRQPSIARARDRALRTAEREQAHPSVVAWTLTNEAAGGGTPDQNAYVVEAARALHARDPGRPVAVDLWGATCPARARRCSRPSTHSASPTTPAGTRARS